MHVGLCTISNKEASAEDVIEHAGAAGYDGIELWGRDHAGDGSSERCGRIHTAAREAGLDIPVYGSYLRAGAEGFDDELAHELDVAERLGADLIRVWAGTDDYGDRDEGDVERAVADLRTVTDRAAGRGLAVTVEKHGGSLTNTREGARRLIEAVREESGADACGLNWQPLFDLPADELETEAAALADLVNNVHLQAVPERGTWGRCPLEEAYFDVPALVATLASEFDGYFEVEFVDDDRPYREAIERDLAYLRDVGVER